MVKSIFLILFTFLLLGCSTILHKELTDKTQSVTLPHKITITDTLAIMKPFVTAGEILGDLINDFNIGDSIRSNSMCSKFYTVNPSLELSISKSNKKKYRSYFRRHPFVFLELDAKDSIVFKTELNLFKNKFRDSSLNTIAIGEQMYNSLLKYKHSYFLFTDIEEYYSNNAHSFYKDFFLIRLYVIDLKKRCLIFYNYTIDVSKFHDHLNFYELERGIFINATLNKFRRHLMFRS